MPFKFIYSMESKVRIFFSIKQIIKTDPCHSYSVSSSFHFFFLQSVRKVTVKLSTQQIIVHANNNNLTRYATGVLFTICMLSVLFL
jgi:hypothetical protein